MKHYAVVRLLSQSVRRRLKSPVVVVKIVIVVIVVRIVRIVQGSNGSISLHICHNKYSVWALALKAIRL